MTHFLCTSSEKNTNINTEQEESQNAKALRQQKAGTLPLEDTQQSAANELFCKTFTQQVKKKKELRCVWRSWLQQTSI